jgi:hypothetical protein
MFAGRVLGMAFRKVELLEFYFREARLEHQPRDGTNQVLDTLTWSKQRHTIKFGGDFRYLVWPNYSNALRTHGFAAPIRHGADLRTNAQVVPQSGLFNNITSSA